MKTFLFILALIFTPVLSYAQNAQCGDSVTVRNHLTEQYGESRRGTGLAQNTLVEIYSNESTGSWTIVVTTPDNRSCLVAAGQNWETITEQAPPNL